MDAPGHAIRDHSTEGSQDLVAIDVREHGKSVLTVCAILRIRPRGMILASEDWSVFTKFRFCGSTAAAVRDSLSPIAREMAGMGELSDRAKANMEVVLEETCRSLPHGGDHDVRAFIAQRLAEAAASGRSTIGHLGLVARKALADYRASH